LYNDLEEVEVLVNEDEVDLSVPSQPMPIEKVIASLKNKPCLSLSLSLSLKILGVSQRQVKQRRRQRK
jgi:hypothetical protein